MELNKFTHVGILKDSQRKIAIMAPVLNIRMYDLVRDWADDAWEELKLAGKVSDAMLAPVESEVAA